MNVRLFADSWSVPSRLAALAVAAFAIAAIGAVAVNQPSVPSRSAAPLPPTPPPTAAMVPAEEPSARAALGRKIFFDTNLSEPAGMSCATCHDPARGYAGNNGSTLGVAQGSRPGHFARRNTPSVLYLSFVHRFHFHWEEDAPLPDAFGGFFWDGRADSIAALTKQPLLNPDEMGNRDVAMIAAKIDASAYAAELRAETSPWKNADEAVAALGEAVQAFLLSKEMAPFSSKYDDVLRGQAELAPAEARGLALFKDNTKGACDFCHKMDDTSPKPERSLFTDYGFETVAVPRNTRLPANRNAKNVDLGLCEHEDAHAQTTDVRWCGSFRTPSLRNVAARPSFMHNGAFTKLRDVVAFYASRETDPRRWYPGGKLDDLPSRYHEFVDVTTPPYNRRVGDPPALDESEIDAIVAFLETLTDAPPR